MRRSEPQVVPSPEPATPALVQPRTWGRTVRQFSHARIPKLAGPVLQFAIGIAVWEFGLRALSVKTFVFPSPSAIWPYLWSDVASGYMIRNAWVTVQETVSGFIIGTLIGFLLGVAIAESMLLRTLLRPYIVAIQAVPKIAVAPLFLIWFGFGMESKAALVVSVVFFPVLVNTVAGFESTKDDQLQLMRAYGASRLQILLRLKLFAALPFIFAAAEVGLVLSLTAAVVAELLGASEGLGAMIQSYGSQLNMPAMFGILIVLSILGVVLHTLVVMVGRRLIFWTGVAGS